LLTTINRLRKLTDGSSSILDAVKVLSTRVDFCDGFSMTSLLAHLDETANNCWSLRHKLRWTAVRNSHKNNWGEGAVVIENLLVWTGLKCFFIVCIVKWLILFNLYLGTKTAQQSVRIRWFLDRSWTVCTSVGIVPIIRKSRIDRDTRRKKKTCGSGFISRKN
jgi:hypothetical protein